MSVIDIVSRVATAFCISALWLVANYNIRRARRSENEAFALRAALRCLMWAVKRPGCCAVSQEVLAALKDAERALERRKAA